MWFQTTLRLTLLKQHSIPPSSTTLSGKFQEEMPKQHKLCMAKQTSNFPSRILTSFSLPLLPLENHLWHCTFFRSFAKNPAASVTSVTFLRHKFCFIFFDFFSLSQYPPPVNPTHWCWYDSLSNYSHHISLFELHWQLLLLLYTKFKFLPLHAKPLGRNPRIIPLPCSYNYMKHLSNLVL